MRLLERKAHDLGVLVAGYVRNQAQDPMEFSEVAVDFVTSVPTSAKSLDNLPNRPNFGRLIKIMCVRTRERVKCMAMQDPV